MTQTDEREFYGSLTRLDAWVQRAGYKAYDPFDGLSAPLAPILTLRQPFLKQVWQQGIRRFPLNLRPLVGVRRSMSTKAMGFFAKGYLRLYQATGDERFLERTRYCLQWLMDNRCPQFKGIAWGNHFDYQSRAGNIEKGCPTIVWTGLIGHAFLDAYEELGDVRYLDVARKVCFFITDELDRDEYGETAYLRYYPKAVHLVHNSNMIGASMLARTHYHAAKPDDLELSKRAVRWTVQHQMANGSWNYGEGGRFSWVDSFHTGYVLETLDYFIRYSGDDEFEENLVRGYDFYINTFFEENGTPRYYDHKTRPLDIQCASQGIQTLVNLRRLNPRSVEVAAKVARWTIANMQDPTGYFYFRKYPLITNKTPTMHWGQATMFSAMATLYRFLRLGEAGAAQVRLLP